MSLKQESVGRYVLSLGQVILIQNQPVVALSPQYCMLCREAKDTNFSLCFDPTGLKPIIYNYKVDLIIITLKINIFLP
jgi:threonine dehydrogenase-like Zn-dependent dehydrogenase